MREIRGSSSEPKPVRYRIGVGARVAVVITCYSGEAYFEEAVASVMRQTSDGVVLVFHDNGCSESYRALMRRLAERSGATIVHTAVNRYGEGLRYDVLPFLASDYVAILHDDDYYEPTKIEVGLGQMAAMQLDYLFTERRHVDAAGRPFAENYEEVNTRPMTVAEFPDQHIADTYYRGLRLHFSTLIMKTTVARQNLMGDPYLPRITDSLYMQRLLLDETLVGCAVPGKLTNVRVHGENDMLYSKFAGVARAREFGLLQFAEYYVFHELIRTSGDERLRRVFALFPGVPYRPDEDRVSLLVRAALDLRNWSNAKPLMGAHCIHEAWLIDPRRTLDKVRELSPIVGGGPYSDANQLMRRLYSSYIANVGALVGGAMVEERSAALALEMTELQQRHALLLRQHAALRAEAARGWPARLGLWTRRVFGRDDAIGLRAERNVDEEALALSIRAALGRLRAGRTVAAEDVARLRAAIVAGERGVVAANAMAIDDDADLKPADRATRLDDLLALAGERVAGQLLAAPTVTVTIVDPDGTARALREGTADLGAYQPWRLAVAPLPLGSLVRIELPALEDRNSAAAGVELDQFHAVERPPGEMPFRWSGPAAVSRVRIPVVVHTPAAIDLLVWHRGVGPLEAVGLRVNGVDARVSSDDLGAVGSRIRAELRPDQLGGAPLDVEIVLPGTFAADRPDPRTLGIAIRSLTLTMDPP